MLFVNNYAHNSRNKDEQDYLSRSWWFYYDHRWWISRLWQSRSARIERVILNYYPNWEKSADGRRSRGYAQLVLLAGIAPSQRTNEVNHR
ncbi:hypothetical protein [Coleofasciculus sp.]|uniref:hypothetical protein n=1 Tax=Coleofasciculus sp. TaxID=3100458 RepID=UPI003A1C800A